MTWPAICIHEFSPNHPPASCLCSVQKSHDQMWQAYPCLPPATPPESDLPPQGQSTQRVISCLAFRGSLRPLTWALLNFWHFLLLNPLVQSVWPLRKSTPTLIPPPPLSPFKILPQLVGFGGKEAKYLHSSPRYRSSSPFAFPPRPSLSSGIFLLGEHLERMKWFPSSQQPSIHTGTRLVGKCLIPHTSLGTSYAVYSAYSNKSRDPSPSTKWNRVILAGVLEPI